MAKWSKERKQAAALAFIAVLFLGIGLYVYRDRLMPTPQGAGGGLPEPVRFSLPSDNADKLFGRDDYRTLSPFGNLPLKPLVTAPSNPFVAVE